jgi:DNA-directed RNA polymerase
LERYKDHVLPVKVARDVYLANRKKASKSSVKSDAESGAEAEEETDETIVVAEDEPLKRRNSRGTPFVNADGEDKDKIEIGSRQFVRLTDALPRTPTKGDFDVNHIRESPYFFS